MTEVPNLPWVVRDADGKAVAAFADKGDAGDYVVFVGGQKITYDHWAAQNPGPRRETWKS